MWPFSKKKHSLLDSGLLQGMTDLHCHILPGVDDGVQIMDEALHTLQELEKLGIRELWLTPHIMEDYPNTPADLRRRFDDLNALIGRPEGATLAVREIGRPEGTTLAMQECSPTLHLAAEHMLDSLFSQRLAKNEVLPISLDKDSSHSLTLSPSHPSHPLPFSPSHPLISSSPLLLVETSYFNPPMNLYDQLEDIAHHGYTPLLAHPERYTYMHTSDYHRLRDMGVEFQLNLLSLTGAYGGEALHKSRHLLSEGLYTCYGTDLHNLDDFLGYASDRCLRTEEITKINQINN